MFQKHHTSADEYLSQIHADMLTIQTWDKETADNYLLLIEHHLRLGSLPLKELRRAIRSIQVIVTLVDIDVTETLWIIQEALSYSPDLSLETMLSITAFFPLLVKNEQSVHIIGEMASTLDRVARRALHQGPEICLKLKSLIADYMQFLSAESGENKVLLGMARIFLRVQTTHGQDLLPEQVDALKACTSQLATKLYESKKSIVKSDLVTLRALINLIRKNSGRDLLQADILVSKLEKDREKTRKVRLDLSSVRLALICVISGFVIFTACFVEAVQPWLFSLGGAIAGAATLISYFVGPMVGFTVGGLFSGGRLLKNEGARTKRREDKILRGEQLRLALPTLILIMISGVFTVVGTLSDTANVLWANQPKIQDLWFYSVFGVGTNIPTVRSGMIAGKHATPTACKLNILNVTWGVIYYLATLIAVVVAIGCGITIAKWYQGDYSPILGFSIEFFRAATAAAYNQIASAIAGFSVEYIARKNKGGRVSLIESAVAGAIKGGILATTLLVIGSIVSSGLLVNPIADLYSAAYGKSHNLGLPVNNLVFLATRQTVIRIVNNTFWGSAQGLLFYFLAGKAKKKS